MTTTLSKRRFSLGETVITRNAFERLHPADAAIALVRHANGDWGDVCEEDKGLNDAALIEDGRLLSVYWSRVGIRFWIITEWDRSVTTILLPEDY